MPVIYRVIRTVPTFVTAHTFCASREGPRNKADSSTRYLIDGKGKMAYIVMHCFFFFFLGGGGGGALLYESLKNT